MPALQLALLGPVQVALPGQPAPRFATVKAQALLAYLAVEAKSAHARDTLLGLFWPDYPQASARLSLRQTLFHLRQAISPAYLLTTRQTIQFDPTGDYSLDVTTFTDLLAACRQHTHADLTACPACMARLQQAVDLYRGDFLTGFFVDDSPAFEEWLLLKREWLRREMLQALHQLAAAYEQRGEYDRAQTYAWRQVELDPPREEAHQQLMRVLALSRRRSEALAQYESCRRLLAEELGVTPSAETVALYEQIRTGSFPDKERDKETRRQGDKENAPASPRSAELGSPLGAKPYLDFGEPRPPSPRFQARAVTPSPSSPKPPDEIRLVTVLCVGVSEAEELPPEAAAQAGERLARLSAPIMAHYGARLDQRAGGGVVAVLGAAQVHEDDPERAVLAALTIRAAAAAAGLVVSAGVSTGNILLSPSGTLSGAESFAGSPVNLALRLQAQAAPGQLLVGESTYRQTHAAIHFTPLTLALPGRTYTRTVYQAEYALARPQKSRGLAPLHADLVGRSKELATLQDALAAVQQGAGQLVTLIGEAGIGKSRLVSEAKLGMRNSESGIEMHDHSALYIPRVPFGRALLWLEGRCLEMAMSSSYWPFLDILRAYLAWQPEEAEASRAGRIVTTLDGLVASGNLTTEQREEMGPLLGNLLTVRFGNEWDERLKFAGPEQIRHQTLIAMRDFFVALTQQQPMVLVLEDLHWADSLSLDLITLFMETVAEQPLLLLCVYRPERQHRCWQLANLAAAKCPERFSEVRLRELTPKQSQQLVEALLTIENLTPNVKAMILQKAQGNPLFVEEVIRSLIDASIVYRQGEVWRAKEALANVVVPETVQSVILSRVDRLGEALKDILQRAAVIGRVFGRRLLAQLAAPGLDLDNALQALTNHAFIYQERVVPEEEYSFKHVLVQEAIYQTTLAERREQLHRQVGEALEHLYADNLAERYEQLAYHYDRSDVIEKAIEYLLKAGEKARRAYFNDEAIRYFQQAQERLAEQPQVADQALGETHKDWRLAALRGLGQTNFGIGKMAEAEGCFRQAIALRQEMKLAPRELVRLYHWLGEVLWWQSRHDEQIQTGEEGLGLLGDDTESVEAALMNSNIAWGYYFKGDLAKARSYTLCYVPFIQLLPHTEELGPAYIRLIIIYAEVDKNVDDAMRWAETFSWRAKQHHDLTTLGDVYEHLAWCILVRIGDLRGAVSYFQKSLELFTKIGNVTHTSKCLLAMGVDVFLPLGDLHKAEDHLQSALAILQNIGHTSYVATLHWFLGIISLCRGLPQNATNAFYKAMQLWQDASSPLEVWALVSLGRTALLLANQEEALQMFQRALSLTKPTAYAYWLQPFTYALCGIEATENDASFHSFCRRFQTEHLGLELGAPVLTLSGKRIGNRFVQWFLEPTQPDFRFAILDLGLQGGEFQNLKSKIQNGEWTWDDQFKDCSFALRDGLDIQAANGRGLFVINRSAPRLLRPATGDFAIQALCRPVADNKPTQGGILLWKDQTNFLRLDRGTFGQHEITFLGCLGNNDVIIGRGRLPAERVFLRLERLGERVNALCSADGEAWFTVGHVGFPVADPVQVGLHAIGMIDRLLYPGAYPEGTAIRFEAFAVYKTEPLVLVVK